MAVGNKQYHQLKLFLFALTFAGFSNLAEASLSVEVRSGDTRCIKFKTPDDQKSKISGSFDMLDVFSISDPLDFTIFHDENGIATPVYGSKGDADGRFHVEGNGKYSLCIGNGIDNNDDGETRHVAFTIRVKPFYEHHDDEPNPVTEEVSDMEDMAEVLIEQLYDLLDHQEFLKERERLHRNVSESTFGNVWMWTLIEKGVLVVVSAAQVFYFKSFFSSRERMMNY